MRSVRRATWNSYCKIRYASLHADACHFGSNGTARSNRRYVSHNRTVEVCFNYSGASFQVEAEPLVAFFTVFCILALVLVCRMSPTPTTTAHSGMLFADTQNDTSGRVVADARQNACLRTWKSVRGPENRTREPRESPQRAPRELILSTLLIWVPRTFMVGWSSPGGPLASWVSFK